MMKYIRLITTFIVTSAFVFGSPNIINLSPQSAFKTPANLAENINRLEKLLIKYKFKPFLDTVHWNYSLFLPREQIPVLKPQNKSEHFNLMIRNDPLGNPQLYLRVGNHVILHKDILQGAEYQNELSGIFDGNLPAPIHFSPYWGGSESNRSALSYLPWTLAVLLQMMTVPDEEWQNKVVLDLGSGMGLLSLLALNKGVKKLIAVERDKTSIEVFKSNLIQNGFSEPREGHLIRNGQEVIILRGSFDSWGMAKKIRRAGTVDIVLENIGGSKIYQKAHLKAAELITLIQTPGRPMVHIGGGAGALKAGTEPGKECYQIYDPGDEPLFEQASLLIQSFELSPLESANLILPWNIVYPVMNKGKLPASLADAQTFLFRASKTTLTPKSQQPFRGTLFKRLAAFIKSA